MGYGQKNYNEILGTSGYRINQIGCFLVSFANILTRFGEPIDPIGLNKIFRDNRIYISGGDLAWSSVTRANPNIVVTGTGLGAPTSNDAIVKFTGVNNSWGTHFCMVHDVSKGLIVDSWDGQIKHWSVYGNPDAWATYRDLTPATAPAPAIPAGVVSGDFVTVQPGWGLSHVAKAAGFGDYSTPARWADIAALNGSSNWQAYNATLKSGQQVRVKAAPTPAPAAPAPQPAPQPAPAPETVDITVQPGWGITHVLKAAGYSKEQWDNEAEWDRVAALNGSATRLRLKPNQVVKVNRTPLPAAQPVPAPVPTPAVEAPQPVAPVVEPPKPAAVENEDGSVSVPVNVVPKDPKAYQKTLVPEEKVYIASTSKLVHDMDGLHMDLQLVSGQKVTSGGRFNKDGKDYIISKKHLSLGQWYGIPADYLGAGKDPNAYVGPLLNDDDDDLDLRDLLDADFIAETREAIGNLSSREKFINVLGKIYDAILKLKFWEKKNKTT